MSESGVSESAVSESGISESGPYEAVDPSSLSPSSSLGSRVTGGDPEVDKVTPPVADPTLTGSRVRHPRACKK